MEPVKPGEWRGEGSMFHHGDTDDEEESFEKGKMSNSEVKKYVDSVICQRCLTECPSRGGSEGGSIKWVDGESQRDTTMGRACALHSAF